MLIHIGQNDFINLDNCELIINLQTIDDKGKTQILSQIISEKPVSELRSAIKTVDGKWFGSVLSSDALSQRCLLSPFDQAYYSKDDSVKDSCYSNQGVI
ncbi:MAG: hypothetical protein BWY02_01845 [bacterium ADurb.Bin157]|jgi:hypothetical protein|nr:hypothetical protein [Candidatus Riflebacteria bacterium]NCB47306.1 hypothetical protein [bacterium]OQB48342.1 MAG: hypothetical protein BWY02_01845 [bacterium ADurb.Bin157]MDD2623960.1 hypothetical protein [Candidatus Riflebacteria bacterium]MDD3376151.1 hypothetical protein [Candidatus Riflebacteria bacterium]